MIPDIKLDNITLPELNLEIAIAELDDCIKFLLTCQEKLNQALRNIGELREYLTTH